MSIYSDLKYANDLTGIQARRVADGVGVYLAPGSALHTQAVAGEFGAIAAYVAPTGVAEAEVRKERDALLTASDWTQVLDAPVDQTAWATYRQALRDIPDQAGFPDNVAWPTAP